MINKRTRRTQAVRQLVCEEEQQVEAVKAHQQTRQGKLERIVKSENVGFAEAKKILKELSTNSKWRSIQRDTKEISFE